MSHFLTSDQLETLKNALTAALDEYQKTTQSLDEERDVLEKQLVEDLEQEKARILKKKLGV